MDNEQLVDLSVELAEAIQEKADAEQRYYSAVAALLAALRGEA